MQNSVEITLEFTPNPNTLKYVINKDLIEQGTFNFPNPQSAAGSPLAEQLFKVFGVSAVMIGRNFVTITKGQDGDWESLNNGVQGVLNECLTKGLAILNPDQLSAQSNHAHSEGEVEQKIKEILDKEIRPAVAMDGGDITFERYENGVVYLYLQGSCSGCPSSTATLKQGIERRLKDAIPEIQEVVSV